MRETVCASAPSEITCSGYDLVIDTLASMCIKVGRN